MLIPFDEIWHGNPSGKEAVLGSPCPPPQHERWVTSVPEFVKTVLRMPTWYDTATKFATWSSYM